MFKHPDNVHVNIPLPDGDSYVKEWVGGLLSRGVSKMGVKLTLTTNHLLVAPLDLTSLEAIFDAFGKWVPGGDKVDRVADFVVEKGGLKDQAIVPLSNIARVQALNNASLFKPPAARLVLSDGSQADFGFVASITTPTISSKNNAIRDDFVATIQSVVSGAR